MVDDSSSVFFMANSNIQSSDGSWLTITDRLWLELVHDGANGRSICEVITLLKFDGKLDHQLG